MAITHDGITCRLPPDPIRILVGLLLLGVGGWFIYADPLWLGCVIAGVAVLVLLNQLGTRRIRVIETKLLVEDEHLLLALLIGPSRRRIGWEQVKGVQIEGGRLRLDTAGAPFITAQGASRDDLVALRLRIEAAMAKAKQGSSKG